MELLTHPHRPRRADYIGDSDQDVLAFIRNLARRMQDQGPAAYGLTASDAAAIIAAHQAYAAAFALASANSTRTGTAVLHKNEMRDEADRIARTFAQIIKNDPGVSNELKIIAGVPVDKARGAGGRSRSNRPGTFPRLSVDTRNAHWFVPEVKVRFCDSELATGRMPREDGVTHMILHAEIVPGPPHPPPIKFAGSESSLRVVAHLTRNPFTLRFDKSLFQRFGLEWCEGGGGAVQPYVGVMFRGQWLNAKGQVGPLRPEKSINVPLSQGVLVSQAKLVEPVRDETEPAMKQAA